MSLQREGIVIAQVFGDGKLLLAEYRYRINQGGKDERGWDNDLSLPLYPVNAWYRLGLYKVHEDPELPGWLTGQAALDVENCRLGTKPFSLYGLESPYWSAALHWPLWEIPPERRPFMAGPAPQRVISVCLRAIFGELEEGAAEERAA